jgi:thiol-disulfide isomerase/thioredoxin
LLWSRRFVAVRGWGRSSFGFAFAIRVLFLCFFVPSWFTSFAPAMHPRLFLTLALVLIASSARAQFYAPDTEYHDPSQRVFPVEAARILAWQRAANGQPPIAEVVYEVSITPGRETIWKIRWLDAAKKSMREKEVRYAETQLVAGPDHYRQVFSQIEGDDWKIGAASPDNAATTFWQGAELSGVTRLDAIKAASTLVREKPKMARAADAARMAGILSHATLPHFTRQVSLDPVFLGRAAAWLCVAESRSREKFDAAWTSILFLSGREKDASELSANALWRPAEKQGAAERFWRTLVSPVSAKDMLLFGARAENKTFAMPMMSYAGSLDTSLAGHADVLGQDVFGNAALARMSEYSVESGIRDPMGEATNCDARLSEFLTKWNAARSDFEPSELDFTGYREAAKKLPPVAGSMTTGSWVKHYSPLLNLGVDESTGPLIPTAHLTARDLFGFGWEMVCLLSAEYYESVKKRGGDEEIAKLDLPASLGSIRGMDVFFAGSAVKVAAPLDSLTRLQYVGSSGTQAALLKKLPAEWAASPDIPLKRQWLSRVATRENVAHLIQAKTADPDFKAIVERLIQEGGRATALDLLRKDSSATYVEAIERTGMRAAIASAAPVLGEVDLEQLKSEIKAAPAVPAGTTPAGTAEVIETLDFAQYKTAEQFWAAVDKLREMPRRSANSPEDRMRQIRAWLEQRHTAAEAFLKAYPADPHRHTAKLMMIDSTLQLERFGDQGVAKLDRNELDAIISASDADETTRGEAEFFRLMVVSRDVSFDSPHTVPPFQQALATYLEKYPKHERAQYVGAMLMQTLSKLETPSTGPLLKKLSQNSNEQIALQAKAILQRREFMLELKKKPLELKFTAFDGTEIDMAKLRGKVVLLDFWASWCGPCMMDAPNVVGVYQKLRERGFEIIGISLDQDRAAMESALKSAKMTWPQHFDGKGWGNEIAARFGVRSIPATWLFDKKGKLREHGLRGKELELRIENLLKEK